jgi:Prp18 domain
MYVALISGCYFATAFADLLLLLLPLRAQDLNARPDAVKNSAAGKRDTRTQKQSKDYLRPLFKLCKQRAVNPGILANLVKVRVCACISSYSVLLLV